jgi:VWFA-related protein
VGTLKTCRRRVTRREAKPSNGGMDCLRTLPLLGFLLLVPALESQNSSAVPAATPPPAQASPTTTLSVDVKVVTLPVTVRDKHGKIETNLTKDDFELHEDGKPQTIRYFNQETNLPLTVGLLVDTSMSERDNLDKERAASRTFLDQMITRPTDRAFVIHFDRQVELLQDLTADHGKLERAVGEIDSTSSVQSVQDNGNDQGSGQGKARRGAGTLLYDAIFLACDEVMKKQTGRKAIVVLTDGEDRGSQETLNSAIESAQKSETVVYTIYYGGHEDHDNNYNNGGMGRHGGYPGGGGGYPGGRYPGGGYPNGGGYPRQQENRPDGKKILQRIAQESGGRFFQVSKKDTVDDVYASIAEELRTQFVLGYTPPKDQSSGYHSITLTTKKKDDTVQTREGYYSGP